MNDEVVALWLGCVDYLAAWDLQRQLVIARRAEDIPDTVLLLEHSPVFTTGRRGGMRNLRLPVQELERRGIRYLVTDRGGDVTYHGPGQLVIYLIMRLADEQRRVRRFVERLERTILAVLDSYGIIGTLDPTRPGVWVGNDKIAALGVAIHHGVTAHGVALNVTVDLTPFQWIVPCGIPDRGVTSLERLLGRAVPLSEVVERWIPAFERQFGRTVTRIERVPETLDEVLTLLRNRRAVASRS